MITAIFVIVEVFILLKNSLYYYYYIIIIYYYMLLDFSKSDRCHFRPFPPFFLFLASKSESFSGNNIVK